MLKKNSQNKCVDEIYHDIFDKATIGIYTISPKGEIDSFNPKMLELAGAKSASQVIGLNVFKMPSYKKAGLDQYFRQGLKGKSFDAEVEYTSQTGDKHSFRHYQGTPLFEIGTKKVKHLLLMVEDITEKRKIEQMKTEFVTMASHQLRTPLTGIKWCTELIKKDKDGKLSSKQQSLVAQITIDNERMIKLVNDLLNLSRIETGHKYIISKKRTKVIKLIDQIVKSNHLQIDHKNIKMDIDLPNDFVLLVDPSKFYQVLQNIIDNAIKYSLENGRIKISSKKNKKETILSIKANGIGIPKTDQVNIFNKFYRAENAIELEHTGTGLGLHIAQSIIDDHAGKIWFASSKKQGTIFYISIPNK